MDAATEKKWRRDMMVNINGVETDGILDNNHERPAFIHGQMQDTMHIILRFAETSGREGKSYLQKKCDSFHKDGDKWNAKYANRLYSLCADNNYVNI
jgi:hypothetical protein